LSEVRWHPDAVLDAESARDWYTEQSPFAARGFLLALEAALQSVTESPLAAAEKLHGCRHYVFPSRYPFTLVYRIGDAIEVVAVAHQKRRPGYWRDR
jgi:plasmid stabilization system protein ParE